MKNHRGWRNGARRDWWPLIIALMLAIPLFVGFTLGLAYGTEQGDVRPALVGFLFMLGVVMIAVVVGMAVWHKLRWLRLQRKRFGDEVSPYDAGSFMDRDPTATMEPADDPDGHMTRHREFSVGPGLHLAHRFFRERPRPKRRI